jgi:molybdopterin/thiamine biosynthesis adenylyltransferase
VGRKKTTAATDRLQQINSKVKIISFNQVIENSEQLTAIIKTQPLTPATVVVNCADQPNMTYTNTLVADACFDLNIKHVLCGGYTGHLSFIGQTVIPHQTACWHCYADSDIHLTRMDGFKSIPVTPTQVLGGTIAQVSSITANIHALEVIKAISGYCPPKMNGCKAELDFANYELNYIDIPKRPDCAKCGTKP